MTASTSPAGEAGTAGSVGAGSTPAGSRPRDADLVLARVHLLLGSLSLARAELETLAGRGALDDEAIRDLAEARWRTGDIGGAGEAAAAWLETHPDDILGLVIAAEAQAALGRPGEARRLAGRAIDRADGSLDPVFAGMQRSPIWPVEPGTAIGPVGVLFDDLHPGPHAVPPLHAGFGGGGWGSAPAGPTGDEQGEPAEPSGTDATAPPVAVPIGPSLWGDAATGPDPSAAAVLDPTALFHRARAALEAGRSAEAATGLILALRESPAIAPAILDLLAGRGEPILALVRGDAQLVVGREVEAMRDHAAAAGGLAAADDATDGTAGDTAASLDAPTEPSLEPVRRPGPGPSPDPTSDPTPDQEIS